MKLIPILGLAAASTLCAAPALPAFYGDAPDQMHAWGVHDGRRPAPPVIVAGAEPGQPPSDAVVLFDGTNLDKWISVDKDGSTSPAKWLVKNGYVEVAPKKGIIRTKDKWADCQLHIEWASPEVVVGNSQGRGNSGIFLCGLYEVQVLDTYKNDTYADGRTGAIYGQNPPLVNATRPPGAWQVYDIIFHPSRFDAQGNLIEAGTVTVIHNGVLLQDNWTYEGIPTHKTRAKFRSHPEMGPIELQDHGNPVRFRNIWIRSIPQRPKVTAESVAAQRKATAATIRAEAAKATIPAAKLTLQLESFVYNIDPATLKEASAAASAYVAEISKLDAQGTKSRLNEIKDVRTGLRYMAEKNISSDFKAHDAALTAQLKKFNLEKK